MRHLQLTDVDRHELSNYWRMFATAYKPTQFHVSRNGLALLVADALYLLTASHATLPK